MFYPEGPAKYANSGITAARILQGRTQLSSSVTPSDNSVVFEASYAADDYYFLWEGQTETSSYQYTDAALTLSEPTRGGCAFEGWYEAADFSSGTVTVILTGSRGNKDFYAKWAVNTP